MSPTTSIESKSSNGSSKRKISPLKKQKVKDLQNLIEQHRVLAIADIDNIGSRQMASLRKSLRGQAVIKVAKNKLFKLALDNAEKKKPGIAQIGEQLAGNLAFLFTDMDPFKLSLFLSKNKSKAPARVGQVATKDIVVPAGNTGFQPGPVITQLQNVGIKTKIQDGTIHVATDAIIASPGDEITLNMVIVLSRLGIEPMEIALGLKNAYEDGVIIPEDILKINIDDIQSQIARSSQETFSLAMEIGYVTSETVPLLISKAYQQALNVSLEASVVSDDTLPLLLAKAQAQAGAVGIALKGIDSDLAPADLPTVETISAEQPKDKPKTKETEEEKPEESDVGLGSLFG